MTTITGTHGADCLCHLEHAHDDGETPATKGSDCELVVDVAELGGCCEDTHVVQLGEELALHACAGRVLSGEERESVCILTQGATKFVVLVVVLSVLYVVPPHDLYFAQVRIMFPLGQSENKRKVRVMHARLENRLFLVEAFHDALTGAFNCRQWIDDHDLKRLSAERSVLSLSPPTCRRIDG